MKKTLVAACLLASAVASTFVFIMQTVALYYDTDESKEGGNAQREKRAPRFYEPKR